ncbi:unnamed protein product [Prunus armeniaca]
MGEWEEKKNPEKKWGGLVLGDEKYKRGRWSGGRFVGVEDGTLFLQYFFKKIIFLNDLTEN